jgi:circadian clock protein KaiC
MLTRLIDYLKTEGITTLSTSLLDSEADGQSAHGISSLMDAWIRLRTSEIGSERRRSISVVKSRGMEHSNQICEFLITDRGFKVINDLCGP